MRWESSSTTGSQLLERLYRSAIDQAMLPRFLDLCSNITQTHNVSLLFHDLPSPENSLLFTNEKGAETAHNYAKFAGRNILIETALPYIQTSQVFRTNSKLKDSELKQSEFYTDFCQKNDIYHSMGATLHADPNLIIGLTFNRQESAPFTPEHQAWAMDLMPHLQTWLAIRNRLGDLELTRQVAWEALNLQEYGIILLDQSRRPLFINLAAQEIVKHSKSLLLCNHGLTSKQSDIASWIAEKVRGSLSKIGSVCPGSSKNIVNDSERLNLMVVPLMCAFGISEQRLSAIFISDLQLQSKSLVYHLCSAYSLTNRESGVACLLMQGMNVNSIAKQLEIKPSTVRTHIKSIYLKTDVHKQSELARIGLSVNFKLPLKI